MAGPHRTQVNEAQGGDIPAACNPAMHSTAVTVDTVPHHLADEATDLLETFPAVELGHPDGHFIAAGFADQSPISADEVGFATARADARIGTHAPQKNLEVSGRQFQIKIELAKIGECPRI